MISWCWFVWKRFLSWQRRFEKESEGEVLTVRKNTPKAKLNSYEQRPRRGVSFLSYTSTKGTKGWLVGLLEIGVSSTPLCRIFRESCGGTQSTVKQSCHLGSWDSRARRRFGHGNANDFPEGSDRRAKKARNARRLLKSRNSDVIVTAPLTFSASQNGTTNTSPSHWKF